MALTVSAPVYDHVIGDLRIVAVDVTPDASYLISGEAFGKDELDFLEGTGYQVIDVLDSVARKVNTTTTADNFILVRWDSANELLQFGWDDETASDSGFVEAASTTDLSAYTARVRVLIK